MIHRGSGSSSGCKYAVGHDVKKYAITIHVEYCMTCMTYNSNLQVATIFLVSIFSCMHGRGCV